MPSLQSIGQERLDASFKGFPLEHQPFRVDQAAEQGLNLLRGDLPFPCAILRESAFLHNSRWFGAFARELDIDFAPHGKTSMAPQILRSNCLMEPGELRLARCNRPGLHSMRVLSGY